MLFQPSGAFSTAPAGSRSARLTLDANPPSKASAILDSGEETPQIWLREIRQCILRGKAQTMDLCRVVFGARRSLRHGEWTGLWRLKEAPFSKSKADKLARIGTWLKTLNAHTCEHLPAGWRILRVLSRLDAGTTAALVASGDIHVDLTFRQAEELVARILGTRPRKEPSSTTLAWVIRFCRRLRAKAPELAPEELYQIGEELDQLLTEIRASLTPHASLITPHVSPSSTIRVDSCPSLPLRSGERVRGDVSGPADHLPLRSGERAGGEVPSSSPALSETLSPRMVDEIGRAHV